MGLRSSSIEPNAVSPGDQICAHLSGQQNVFRHHAIYLGTVEEIQNTVGSDDWGMISGHFRPFSKKPLLIHQDTEKICIVTLTDFQSDYPNLELVQHSEPCNPPKKVILDALKMLDKKHNPYNRFTNNCEHFANWCKIGKEESKQVEYVAISVSLVTMGLATTTVAAIVIAAAHDDDD